MVIAIESANLLLDQPDARPQRYAFLVGIKDYDHSKLTTLS